MKTPRTEAELAEAVAGAAGPLRIVGGGTRPIGVPVEGAVLSTAGLKGISLYEPGSLTIVARAGTPLAEIEAALAAEGQRLPFEPMDHRALLGTEGVPTIGGVVAANVSGPRRIQAGACRDSLIGVRFVDGRGQVISNGGRVMKNVTGYDLVKLMAGSYGTLGVLSEVSFKVLPAPETAASVMIYGAAETAAVAAMSRALGAPFDVSGAYHGTAGTDGVPVTILRVEGFEASVAYRAERLTDLLREFGEISVLADPDAVAAQWAAIRDQTGFAGVSTDLWRISVKPGDAPALAARLPEGGHCFDWGGGLIWAAVDPGVDLRARLGGFAGHATLVRASAETRAAIPAFHPEVAPVQAINRGLRARFDPRGILNPGVMG